MSEKQRPFFVSAALVWLCFVCGCATLPKDVQRPTSYALQDTQQTTLATAVARKSKKPNERESGFHLLANGLDAFVARALLCEKAERSLDVQYYLFHDDLIGRIFSDRLLKAADRGVRVRLLVDDMDLEGRDTELAAMDSHPNLEVRIFNPFSRNVGRTSQFLTRLGSVTRRMHNKSFTADNQVTILGGRNIGEEYFEANPDLSFKDLDVMAIGPVVRDVSAVFDRYWNSELAFPVSVLLKNSAPTDEQIRELRKWLSDYSAAQHDSQYAQALRESQLADQIRSGQVRFGWGEAQVVFDQPEKLLHGFDETKYHLAPMLRPYSEGVQTELIIFSPYFVPGAEGTAFLTGLARRGVRVRILTNSLASNDVSLIHAGYKKYRRQLLRGGVELYELDKTLTRGQREAEKVTGGSSKASLHAKSFVFDRRHVFIGSLNLDPRAMLHNTEIGVVLTVPEIAAGMSAGFEENIDRAAFRLELRTNQDGTEELVWHGVEKGEPVVFTHDPHTGFWRRAVIEFLSWWPIESQL